MAKNEVVEKVEQVEEVQAEVMGASKKELSMITEAQKLMSTNYDNALLINQVAQSIGLPDKNKYPNVSVNIADVLTVIKRASAMHLDPLLGAVYAFKNKDGCLTCGVSKQGWQQALHAQKDFVGLRFEPIGELVTKRIQLPNSDYKDITVYPAVKCVITKLKENGLKADFEAIAYSDEECDFRKETWRSRPKRMLESRALTICASNAYGWGAYDEEEIRDLARQQQGLITNQAEVFSTQTAFDKASGNDRAKALILKTQKDELMAQMKKATNRQELVAIFKSADADLKKDDEVIKLGEKLANEFNDVEEL